MDQMPSEDSPWKNGRMQRISKFYRGGKTNMRTDKEEESGGREREEERRRRR